MTSERARDNLSRTRQWIEAVRSAAHEADASDDYLKEPYHRLFRPDASMFVPGSHSGSGSYIGFAGWQELHRKTALLAAGRFSLSLAELVANDHLVVAVVKVRGTSGRAVIDTNAVELRWFDADGFVTHGEFMASDAEAFASFYDDSPE